MRVVDTSGLKCPQPIIETKKALRESGTDEQIEVIIDNPTSVRNVKRFLDDNRIGFTETENSGKWILAINSKEGAVVTTAAEDYCEIDPPKARKSGFGVAITSENMGSGDDELGRQLMKSFFITISCMEKPPSVIVFYNSGVKLMAYESGIIDIVREMELKGTEVLICGTCIDHFKLGGQIKVGTICDMLTIITKLSESVKVIRP